MVRLKLGFIGRAELAPAKIINAECRIVGNAALGVPPLFLDGTSFN